jgi:FkbM family methyltransferase
MRKHQVFKELGWSVSRGRTKIAIENIIDFLTIFDLYVNHHYAQLEKAVVPGCIVWDIGANLCATSLIFANNPKVAHVYAYEPMPQTLAFAKRTLKANADLALKITLEEFGVGGADGILEVKYTSKAKCAIGITAIPSNIQSIAHVREADLERISVPIADAHRVLEHIRSQHPTAQILMKLDAEGAEYEIIERLVSTGGISEIASAAIEWHSSPGCDHLLPRLREAGFETSSKSLEADGSIGMIDAWRSRTGTCGR